MNSISALALAVIAASGIALSDGPDNKTGRNEPADPKVKVQGNYEPAAFKQFTSLPADFAPPVLKDPYDKVAPDPKHWPVLVAKLKSMELDFKGFAREDMKSIKAHVLITIGDRDGLRPEHAVEMFRLIPNAQLAVFPGADHFLLWTKPEKLLTPIAAFLDAPLPDNK